MYVQHLKFPFPVGLNFGLKIPPFRKLETKQRERERAREVSCRHELPTPEEREREREKFEIS